MIGEAAEGVICVDGLESEVVERIEVFYELELLDGVIDAADNDHWHHYESKDHVDDAEPTAGCFDL